MNTQPPGSADAWGESEYLTGNYAKKPKRPIAAWNRSAMPGPQTGRRDRRMATGMETGMETGTATGSCGAGRTAGSHARTSRRPAA